MRLTQYKNGFMVCKKCKTYFHPDWLEDHKLQHEGKGMFGEIKKLLGTGYRKIQYR